MKLIIIAFVLTGVSCQGQNYFHQYDQKFKDSSGVSLKESQSIPIEHLEILCRIWGFLKYYHPAVRAGNYNWDYELFQVIPLLANKSAAQRDDVIYNWVKSFPLNNNPGQGVDSAGEKRMTPDLRWIRALGLGFRLAELLDTIGSLEKNDSSYYVRVPSIPWPDFKHENAYAQFNYPDPGYRILALFRYWNVIKYYYPYRYNLETIWDSVLHYEIKKFINAKNELDYKLAILELISSINDSHAGILEGGDVIEKFKGERRVAAEPVFVKETLVVGYYYDSIYSKKSSLLKGDIITSINNRPIDEIVKEKLAFTPASNYAGKLRNIALDILRTNDTALSLSIIRDNVKLQVTVKCVFNYYLDEYARHHKKDTCFKILPGNIGYINPLFLRESDIPGIMKSVLDTKGLIIDFRYGVRENILSIGDYICDKEYPFAKITGPSNRRPGQFTFFKTMTIGKPNKPVYDRKLILLVNEHTQSSSETNVVAFSKYVNKLIIGSKTAGADGAVATFSLPGGVLTSFSSLGVYYNDNKEVQIIGIIPDIHVEPTVNGLKQGKDELLEKALSQIDVIRGL